MDNLSVFVTNTDSEDFWSRYKLVNIDHKSFIDPYTLNTIFNLRIKVRDSQGNLSHIKSLYMVDYDLMETPDIEELVLRKQIDDVVENPVLYPTSMRPYEVLITSVDQLKVPETEPTLWKYEYTPRFAQEQTNEI